MSESFFGFIREANSRAEWGSNSCGGIRRVGSPSFWDDEWSCQADESHSSRESRRARGTLARLGTWKVSRLVNQADASPCQDEMRNRRWLRLGEAACAVSRRTGERCQVDRSRQGQGRTRAEQETSLRQYLPAARKARERPRLKSRTRAGRKGREVASKYLILHGRVSGLEGS